MSVITKVLRGNDPNRSTRFHDENNKFMGWGEFKHLPYSLITALRQKTTGNLPELPWWPFPVIETLEKLIKPSWTVLEFGSGTSSIWLAKRAATIYCVEGSPNWCNNVLSFASKQGLSNLIMKLRDSSLYPNQGHQSEEFNIFFADVTEFHNIKFDLIIVDGAARFTCIHNSLPLLKPGGYLYLDNSDADKDWAHYTNGEVPKLAQALLKAAEREGIGTIEYFRGLSPATIHASEGMLFRKNLN